jgi:hypothetical protein
MWFFMTKPGKFRAKLYLHPNENDVGFHIESLKTTKFPKFSWNVSVFVNQFHERKWVLQLARVIGNIGKKYSKKTYKIKKGKRKQNVYLLTSFLTGSEPQWGRAGLLL